MFCVRVIRPDLVRFWLYCEALNRKTVNQVIGVFRSPVERNYVPEGKVLCQPLGAAVTLAEVPEAAALPCSPEMA